MEHRKEEEGSGPRRAPPLQASERGGPKFRDGWREALCWSLQRACRGELQDVNDETAGLLGRGPGPETGYRLEVLRRLETDWRRHGVSWRIVVVGRRLSREELNRGVRGCRLTVSRLEDGWKLADARLETVGRRPRPRPIMGWS